MTGHDRPTSRLAFTKSVFPEDERHAILLPNTTVTLYAILIQDGLNLITEANRITRHLVSEPRSDGHTKEGGCNKGQDNSRSTGWGWSAEHNRHSQRRLEQEGFSLCKHFERAKPSPFHIPFVTTLG